VAASPPAHFAVAGAEEPDTFMAIILQIKSGVGTTLKPFLLSISQSSIPSKLLIYEIFVSLRKFRR
jgi:hypothetical protein